MFLFQTYFYFQSQSFLKLSSDRGTVFFPNSLCHFSIEGKFPITSKEMYHSRYFSILCKTEPVRR